jgi:hypothetical protein
VLSAIPKILPIAGSIAQGIGSIFGGGGGGGGQPQQIGQQAAAAGGQGGIEGVTQGIGGMAQSIGNTIGGVRDAFKGGDYGGGIAQGLSGLSGLIGQGQGLWKGLKGLFGGGM